MIRELGPPDLCHIVKAHSSNRNEPDIGSYHHILGADTSSSASLAAYINSLQYSLNETPGWFGANSSWKIASGTYCSYNAFSKVDLRVQAKIPGGVDAYAVNAQGERGKVTEQLWKECQISSLLRAIHYADPVSYSATGLRRLTPVASPGDETRVIECITEQFWNGWMLGSNAETQVATSARNFLVDGIRSYFGGEGRHGDLAKEILAPLAYSPLGGQPSRNSISSTSRSSLDGFRGVDPEVAALLAESYLESDEEVQAARVMHQALKVKPSCFPLLSVQAEFLRRKGCLDAALSVARMAVKYAPNEFQAWTRLTQIYIEREDFHNALLTLNTCPMYTFFDQDYPRVPTPRRINFPVKSDVLSDYDLGEHISGNDAHGPMPSGARASTDTDAHGMVEEQNMNENSVILKLPAPTLRNTFARAYALLADIVSVVGWDKLLKLRSQVFVMEEEYRSAALPKVTADDYEEGEEDADDHTPLSQLRERANGDVKYPVDSEQKAEEVTEQKPEDQIEEKPVEFDPNSEVQSEETDQKKEEQAENKDTEKPAEQAEQKPEQKPDDKPAEQTEDRVEQKPEPNNKPSKGKRKNKNKNKKGKKANNPPQPQQSAPGPKKEQQEEEPVVEVKDKMEDISLNDNANGEEQQEKEAEVEKLENISLDDEKIQEPANCQEEQHVVEPDVEKLPTPQTAVFTPQEDQDQKAMPDQQKDHEKRDEDGDSIARKRLCERWLDNLIMTLFDDLRAYTSWRSKFHNMRAAGQPVTYQYTQAEWEALGDLALRLHRPSEAREAYEYALNIRFSAKAWQKLLEIHTGTYRELQQEEYERHEGVPEPLPVTSLDSLMQALEGVVWLSVYHDRWYNNMSYPNPVCEQVIKLVKAHGLSKVQNTLVSMNLKPAVFAMVRNYLEIAEKFEVTGFNW